MVLVLTFCGAASLFLVWSIVVSPVVVLIDHKEMVCPIDEPRFRRIQYTCTDSVGVHRGSATWAGTDPGDRTVTVWRSQRYPELDFVPREMVLFWAFLAMAPVAFGVVYLRGWIRSWLRR